MDADRRRPGWRFWVALAVVAAIGAGCKNDDDDDGGAVLAAGEVLGVSFVGFPVAPGQPPPPIFADETLQFTFDGPIDDGIFGGFVEQAGQPVVYTGVSGVATQGVPYYAYVDQAAAMASLQLYENSAGGPSPTAYIVGRRVDRPDILVVDPRVGAASPVGLPVSLGFIPQRQYIWWIPPGNGIRVGGAPAVPAGTDPANRPIPIPPYDPAPALSRLFITGASYGPDPVPPEVASIEAQSGSAGTLANPIPATDSIVITFTKPISSQSIDLLANFTIRNTSASNFVVPGTIVQSPADPRTFVFTPTPSFGPGPYDIEVRVGSFGSAQIPPILGVPQGQFATQLPLANSLARTFRTAACPTCVGAASVATSFDNNAEKDLSFVPQFNPCSWNDTTSPVPGSLAGVPISGTPYASFSGGILGTRSQRVLPVSFPGVIGGPGGPAGLFSPFDDNGVNNLGAGINPAGGSHIMHLYEAADLGAPRNSLELVEWGPVNSFVQQTVYPQYLAWCGMTTFTAPVTCPVGVPGMTAVYSQNYNVAPPQPVDPLRVANPPVSCPFPLTVPPNTPGGVRVSGVGTNGVPYLAGPGFTTYYPFPLFSPPFDYIGSGTGAANLILEQNIAPGNQLANFNRFRASAVAPVRRIIGAPQTFTANCVAGSTVGAGAGCDTYDMRFTFVAIVSSCRSNFYDSGASSPTYTAFNLNPRPQEQPAATSALWELEGASAIAAPNVPSGVTTGFLTFFSGTPATGIQNPLVLSNPASGSVSLSGRRYFRFRATLRNENVNNGRQVYNSAVMSFTF